MKQDAAALFFMGMMIGGMFVLALIDKPEEEKDDAASTGE